MDECLACSEVWVVLVRISTFKRLVSQCNLDEVKKLAWPGGCGGLRSVAKRAGKADWILMSLEVSGDRAWRDVSHRGYASCLTLASR